MLYFYPITLVVSLFSSINLKYNTKAPNFTLLGVKLGACFTICWFSAFIAEREGFEPPVQLPVHRISSAARSTTPAPLLFGRGRRACPVLPIQNRCFGTANIGIFFIFAHFRAEKITFGWKNASGGPVSATFPELFVSLTSSEDTPARQNAGKVAFAFAGSYLCKRTDPLRACSIFRARPFIKKNDTKTGTVFVWYLKN